jgi:hypothetical protein
MTRQAKSLTRSKSKASRATAAKKPRGKGTRVKGALARRDALDDLVDAAARALDLKVEPAWQGTVKANLAVTFALASLFADFPLPDDAEPAPIFSA